MRHGAASTQTRGTRRKGHAHQPAFSVTDCPLRQHSYASVTPPHYHAVLSDLNTHLLSDEPDEEFHVRP